MSKPQLPTIEVIVVYEQDDLTPLTGAWAYPDRATALRAHERLDARYGNARVLRITVPVIEKEGTNVTSF